jgi:hypothetical protein
LKAVILTMPRREVGHQGSKLKVNASQRAHCPPAAEKFISQPLYLLRLRWAIDCVVLTRRAQWDRDSRFLVWRPVCDMPIKVQCACGAAFAAKDELAGKTVKCPKCKSPLKIAAAGGSPKSAAQAVAAKPSAPKAVKVRPVPQESAAVVPVTSTESLFDEIGLQAAAAGTRPCPGCTEPMPIEAVVCIKCGYNSRIGRRMETAKVGGADGDAGHGAVANALLEKAAQTLEDDENEDRKKTGEGMPWWVYLIGLAALVGFLGTMLWLGNKAEWEKEEAKKKEKQGQVQVQRWANGTEIAGFMEPATWPRAMRPLNEANS